MFAKFALSFFALATFSSALYVPRSPGMPTFFDRFVSLIPVPAVNALDARDDVSPLVQREPYPIVDSRDFDELEMYAGHLSAGCEGQTNLFPAVA